MTLYFPCLLGLFISLYHFVLLEVNGNLKQKKFYPTLVKIFVIDMHGKKINK